MTLRPAKGKANKDSASEVRLRLSDEEIESRFEAFAPAETRSKLTDAQFKIRVEGGDELLTFIKNQPSDTVEAEVVFCWLKKKTGYKDSNFQVLHRLFSVLDHIVTSCTSFNAAVASVAVPSLVEKIADAKLKQVTTECLGHMIERVGLSPVFSPAIASLATQKAPKIIADALQWMSTTLTDFGVRALKTRELIDFLKATCLESANPTVRTAAITVLTTLHLFSGPTVRGFVEDTKPALLALIDAEFSKVASQSPPPPTRFIQGQSLPQQSAPSTSTLVPSSQSLSSSSSTSLSASSTSVALDEDALEALLPRQDLTSQLSAATLKELGDAQWKLREAALGQIMRTVQASKKRLQPQLGSELLPALKARLADTNRNLCVSTLHIIAVLAESIGRPFEQHLKVLLVPLLGCLGDSKPQVRTACIAALDAMHLQVGLFPLLSGITTVLALDHSVLRRDLLCWLDTVLSTMHRQEDAQGVLLTINPTDPDKETAMTSLLKALFVCMEDRSAEARKYAQGCLWTVAQTRGIESVKKAAESSLKPSSAQTIVAYLEKQRDKTAGVSDKEHRVTDTVAMVTTPSRARPASSSAWTPRKASGKSSAVSATGTVKTATVSTSTITAAASLQEQPALLLQSTVLAAKEQRREQDKTQWRSGSLEAGGSREDLADVLQMQMAGWVNEALRSALFALDFRETLAAITSLDEFVSGVSAPSRALTPRDVSQRVLASLDLLLKYLTLRLSDTNTTLQLKCLDLLDHVLVILEQPPRSNALSEEDTALQLLFPVLIHTQLGDTKEAIRSRIKPLFRRVTALAGGAPRVLPFLLDALVKSKNMRVRCSVLEEMAYMFSLCTQNAPAQQGSAAALTRALPVIASQVGDRDAGLRQAALACLQEAYLLLGESVYRALGARLPDKDLVMIQERLRRTTKPTARGMTAPPEAVMAVTTRDDEKETRVSAPSLFTLDLDALALPLLHTVTATATVSPARSDCNQQSSAVSLTGTPMWPGRKTRTAGHAVLSLQQSVPVSESLTVSFNAREPALWTALKEAKARQAWPDYLEVLQQLMGQSSDSPRSLLPYMEGVMQLVMDVLRAQPAGVSTQMTMVSAALIRSVSLQGVYWSVLSEQTIVLLLDTLLQLYHSDPLWASLWDDLMSASTQPSSPLMRSMLLRALIRVLENPSPAVIVTDALSLLCLQMINTAAEEQEDLAVDRIMLAVHEFLVVYPPAYWKRRAVSVKDSDLPWKAIQGVVRALVLREKHREASWASLERVLFGCVPQPASSYAFAMAKACYEEDLSVMQREKEETRDLTREMEMMLKRVANKEETKAGLSALHQWLQEEGSAGAAVFERAQQQCSEFMQGYLRRGLQSMEDDKRRQGWTPVKSAVHKPAATAGLCTIDTKEQPPVAENYKAKLQQLQQLYGRGLEKSTMPLSPRMSQTPERSSLLSHPALNPERGKSPMSVGVQGNSSLNDTSYTATTVPARMSSMVDDSTIADIKERLARFRVSIKEDV